MNAVQEMQDLPRSLREGLVKNRAAYESLIRQTRWGDGPIFVLGSGPSLAVGISACYAFEDLAGWPGILRHPSDFAAYSLAVLRPGSVVMPIDLGGDAATFLAAAEAARRRGARILVVTNRPSSSLAQMADGVFAVGGPGDATSERASVGDAICVQAAVNYIAWLAAKTLKRPRAQIDALEEEFAALPQHLEWMLGQLRDAARTLGSAVAAAANLYVAGGGHYRATAVEWARSLSRLQGTRVECLNPWEFQPATCRSADSTVVCISGSRCRIKKQMHELARTIKIAGVKLLSVTDSNDRELAERSDLAVLVPVLGEATGSVLALALLEWASDVARPDPARRRDQKQPPSP